MIATQFFYFLFIFSKSSKKQGIVLDVLSPNEWYLKIFCWVTKASLLFQQYSFWIISASSGCEYMVVSLIQFQGQAGSYILFHSIFYDQKFLILWSMELRYWLRWCSVLFHSDVTLTPPNNRGRLILNHL